MDAVRRVVSWIRCAVFALIPLMLAVYANAAVAPAQQPKFRPAADGIHHEYIVTLGDVSAENVSVVAAELGKTYGAIVRETWTHALQGFWATMPEASARAMSADPRVRYVAQDLRMYSSGKQDTYAKPLDGDGRISGDYYPVDPAEDILGPHPLWHLARLNHREKDDPNDEPNLYRYSPNSTGSDVRIYVVDSGVLRFHQELADPGVGSGETSDHDKVARHQRVIEARGSNVTNPNTDSLPSSVPNTDCDGATMDLTELVEGPEGDGPILKYHANEWFDLGEASHGLVVAAVAAGRNTGVAKDATIVPVKVVQCDRYQSVVYFVRAFDWILRKVMANPAPSVVTTSAYANLTACGTWEGAGCKNVAIGTDGALQAFEEAVQTMLDYGIPVVASANNNGRDACNDTPARLSWTGGFGGPNAERTGVITVGGWAKGADQRYVAESANSDGTRDASNWGPCVAMFAPAEKIAAASTVGWNEYRRFRPNNLPTGVSGTSYSAPMVAGLIARMFDEDDELAGRFTNDGTRSTIPRTVWDRLRSAATPFGETALRVSDQGRGAIQASGKRLAYMGAFTLKDQPTPVVVLNGTRQTLSAVPVGDLAYETVWYRVDDGVSVWVSGDHELCIQKNTEGCQAPAVNKQYWARVSRTEEDGVTYYTDSARTTVVVNEPVISTQPTNLWIGVNDSPSLSVDVKVPEGASQPSYKWYRYSENGTASPATFTGAESPTLTIPAGEPSAGYYVRMNGSDALKSDVAFVRVQSACGNVTTVDFDIFPLLGDVKPLENVRVTLRSVPIGLETRWYAGTASDVSHPLRFTPYERSTSVSFKAGTYPKIWAQVYDGDCVVSQTATIDLSAIEECNLGLPVKLPPHLQNPLDPDAPPERLDPPQRFFVSNPTGTTPEAASRLLSVYVKDGETPPFQFSYDWYLEKTVAEKTVFEPVSVSTADVLVSTLPPVAPGTPYLPATYRVLVRKGQCAWLSDGMTVRPQPNCPRALDPNATGTITKPQTISMFPGQTVKFPFTRAVGSYEWLLGSSDFDPPVDGACSNPCVEATRVATQQERIRLRVKQFCSSQQPSYEESAEIFLDVIPCSGEITGTQNDRPSFDITIDAPGVMPNQTFQLRAPEGVNAKYTWYAGLYPDGVRVSAEGSADPTIELGPITTDTRYYVVVEHTGCDGTPKKFYSRSILVNPCKAAGRRRPSSSCQSPCTAYPGSTILLSVVDEHDGTTFKWYEGNDYTDTSRFVGTGASILVAPLGTTSYWVRSFSACSTAPPADGDIITIEVGCSLAITKEPEPAVSTSGSVSASVEAVVPGEETLSYQWYSKNPEDPAATFEGDGTSATYTLSGAAPLHRDVYVKVSAGANCTVESRVVRLSLLPSVNQRIFGYTPGARAYSPSLPQKLMVTMDPPEGPDHEYAYSWYRDDGTPGGQRLTDNTPDRELNVTTSAIDRFWVVVRGKYNYDDVDYYEYTTSKSMYVELYGTCLLPPLKVTQSHVTIDPYTSPSVVLNAFCDWHDVEFEWYAGQTGDTRYPVNADLGKPHQLTVSSGAINPYWVRAKRECGSYVDSPTITFSRGLCGPTMINQNVASVDVDYGDIARLYVDPLAVDRPSYSWYQNEGQETPVFDTDEIPTQLRLENVQKSGRYWVLVRNLDCSNSDESYMATVRVATHPDITPREWQTEVWTDSGTPATLTATSGNATHYQWFAGEVGDERAGRLIENEIFDTYVTPPLTSEAKYWARVYAGTAGNLDSPTITVKICERPRITSTSTPTLNLLPGQALYLDVTAEGTGLTYQWYKGGTPGEPSTATAVGFPINRLLIQPTQTTTYWLMVTGHCGTDGVDTRTAYAAFTASVCPVVNEVPTAAHSTVMPGATTTLSIDADGYDLQYQWYIGTPGSSASDDIDGAVSATITTPPINGPTSFWCKVTSGTCSRDSEAVVIGLCSEPTIRWIDGNKSVSKGDVVDFIIDADHSTEQPMVTVYAGPAGDVAVSTVVVPAQPVYHFTQIVNETTTFWARAVVDNCYADTGNITITVCIPKITTQPAPASIIAGNSTNLNVATDIPPASYQWYIGETGDISAPVDGATTATLTVSPTVTTKYWVRVKGCGSSEADSVAVLVSVCTPANIASHTPSHWITKGATRELTADGQGTDLTYLWYRGTAGDTTHQIGNSFSVFVSPSDTTSYWARVSNGCGSDDTDTIVVSVCATPVIAAEPQSQNIFSGTTATLSVTAMQATSTPMTYQWYSGSGTSNPIAGATASTYTTPALTAATTYWARIAAGTCSVDSAPATISMCAYTAVINVPDDRDIAVGQTVRLSALLSPVPQQVRWYLGAQGDHTNPISVISYVDVSPTVTTQYWAEFTHDGCTAKSRTVTVFVSVPTITQQPASVQVNNGQTATLTVNANTAGVAYQWYSGTSGSGTIINGATSPNFTTPPMTTTASYWVKVTGSRGHTVNSNTATVSVCVPASISQHPSAASIRRGSSASLSVNASGTNLLYQWYRASAPSETNPSGATASISISPTDPSNYWVKVTSDCGTANSNTATVSVCIDPTINTQPASPTIYSGSTATLSVIATAGTALPLSYQWYSGTSGSGTIISGATSATYTTPALTSSANYWVKVTSGVCSTNSATATVSICGYAATINAPSDRDIAIGDTVRLSVNLSPVPTSGKWYRGAQGVTTNQISSYTFVDVSPTATTGYWGELTHEGCSTKTRTVTVYVSIPTITQQPAATTQVNGGQPATLTVAANTTGLTYQWYSGASGSGTPISGATGATYVTPALAAGSAASYWVKVTGSRGHAVNSNTAAVTWCTPASITRHPFSASIRRGSSVSMTVDATGTNLRYQWYRATSPNEVNGIGSATASQYNIVPLDTVSYWVKVTSDCGVANSTTAQIDVCLDPTINTQPLSQYVNSGTSATLSVAATANTTLGLSYQWYSGTSGSGTAIAGATSSTYTTPALTAAANYWVRVTSGVCSTESATAAISICSWPATVNAPADKIAKAGTATLLTLSLSPTPQTYKWYRGAQGDRTNLLSTQPSVNVYPTVTTQYWGEFTGNGCTTKTRTVTVNVCIPTITAQPQSVTIPYATTTTLSVSATQASTYQWYKGSTGQAIPGATSASYTTPVLYDNESYWVSTINTSCNRNTDSAYAYVTVD